MKRFITFLLSTLLIFTLSFGALAENLLISSVTKEGENWVVKGTWQGDKPLTIEVLKKTIVENDTERNLTWDDVLSANNADILNYLAYFNQTDSPNSNGGFEFKIAGMAEEPEIRVFSNGEYFYHSRATLDKINDSLKVNEEAPEEQFDNLIMGYGFLNGIITELTEPLNEDEKDEFWNKLYTYKESKSGGFTNFGDIVTASTEIAILSKVMMSETISDLNENLELLEPYGIKDSNSYDLYAKKGDFQKENYLTNAQKEALFTQLKAKAGELNYAAKFVEYFNEKVVLTACFDNSSDYLVKDIIDKSDVLANEGTGKYSSLKAAQKLEVAESINGADSEFASASELSGFIASKATKLANDNSSSQGSGNKGGSLGGNSSYNVVTKPVDTTPPQETKNDFSDLSSHKWAETAIYALRDKGIINGTSESTFEPERGVTREEFVKMLVLAMNALDQNAKAPFADITDGAWYAPYVASAYNAKLINGITAETFGIGTGITREQLAVMIHRAILSKGEAQNAGTNSSFTDIDSVSSYAVDAVNYVSNAGIMNGMGDGSFAPQAVVTRAQAAKVIYELLFI